MCFRYIKIPANTATLFILTVIFCISSCKAGSSYDEAPYRPSDDDSASVDTPWQDVLNGDSAYPDNVYLTAVVEFHPGLTGTTRWGNGYVDEDGKPIDAGGALGPPEGSYPSSVTGDCEMAVMGKDGWAVWRFDPDYRIFDGDGDDFITFSNHNVLFSDPDGSWNEIGRVFVSEDGVGWYENSNLTYISHPEPGTDNEGYDWSEIHGLHGNNHTWANFRNDNPAEFLDPDTGCYTDLLDQSGEPVLISRYFGPEDSNLGGDRFDLSDFVHVETGDPWPVSGKMSYLKIVDDPSILDGQDYCQEWMLGARVMAAMGINVETFGGTE